MGAIALGVAVSCALLALRRASIVERRLSLVRAADRGRDLIRAAREDANIARIAAALGFALVASALSAQLALGVLPVPLAAYAGLIAPSIAAERHSASRRRAAERAVVTLVEWLHALVSSGRPIEAGLDSLAARGSGDRIVDAALKQARHDYTLGVPLHVALAANGRRAGVAGLVELASRIERARELGRGALPILQDLRDELRAQERSRVIQSASHVDGRLTLVLTLCYLPALALLVIVPLFLTLLAGLFG